MTRATLPTHLHEFEGNLWRDSVIIRRNYARHHREVKTGQDLRACLRAGPYCFPGGYEILFLCSDGACLCSKCVREELPNVTDSIRNNLSDGWRVVAVYTMAECDESQICAHCNREVE